MVDGPRVQRPGSAPELFRPLGADRGDNRSKVDVLVVLAQLGLGRRGEDRRRQLDASTNPGGRSIPQTTPVFR